MNELNKELAEQVDADSCQGTNCGTTTGNHSSECLAEAAASQRWELKPGDLCGRDCPIHKIPVEQAEVERPEVVARVVHSNPIVLGQCGPLNANDELMTVAQHAASVVRWAEMFNRVEQQRDAALARVAELEACGAPALLAAADYFAERAKGPSPGWVTLSAVAKELRVRADIAPVAQAQQLHDLDKQCRDDVARALGLRPNQERGFAWSYLLASIKSCVKASEDSAQAQHSVPEGWVQSLPLKDHQPCKPNEDRANGYTIPIYSRPVLVEEALRKLRAVLCDPIGNVVIDGSDGDREEVQRALGMLAAAPGKEVGHE